MLVNQKYTYTKLVMSVDWLQYTSTQHMPPITPTYICYQPTYSQWKPSACCQMLACSQHISGWVHADEKGHYAGWPEPAVCWQWLHSATGNRSRRSWGSPEQHTTSTHNQEDRPSTSKYFHYIFHYAPQQSHQRKLLLLHCTVIMGIFHSLQIFVLHIKKIEIANNLWHENYQLMY